MCPFKITLVAEKHDSFMFRILVNGQMTVPCGFKIALVTEKPVTVMFRFLVDSKLLFCVVLKSLWSQRNLTPSCLVSLWTVKPFLCVAL